MSSNGNFTVFQSTILTILLLMEILFFFCLSFLNRHREHAIGPKRNAYLTPRYTRILKVVKYKGKQHKIRPAGSLFFIFIFLFPFLITSTTDKPLSRIPVKDYSSGTNTIWIYFCSSWDFSVSVNVLSIHSLYL